MGSIGEWNQIEPDLPVPNLSLNSISVSSAFAYYYHLVNGISSVLAQSDPIKPRPL
jgi:hypothetical protein